MIRRMIHAIAWRIADRTCGCHHDHATTCGDENGAGPGAWSCSLPPGHKGPHVACGEFHRHDVWADPDPRR